MIFHPVSPALRRVSNRFALSFATKFLKTYLPLTFVLYAALAVSAATAATTAYKVERLLYQSSTGPSSVAKAINANGEAVGVISNSGEDIPTLWDVSGRSTDMTVPGAPFFTELGGGINRAGDVPLNHGGRAYVWNAGVLREIADGKAFAINDARQLIGLFESQLALYTNGVLTPLPAPGDVLVYDLNNRAEAVGYAFFSGSPTRRAALWRDGGIIDLGTLPGDASSYATAINDLGQVVGCSVNADNSISRGFLWENGVMTALDAPGKSICPNDINNAGQIVGTFRTDVYGRAFVMSAGVFTDLTAVLGTDACRAAAISDDGRIVGTCETKSLPITTRGFRLTPTQGADVSVLQAAEGAFFIGKPLAIVATVTNAGDTPATAVEFRGTLPASLRFQSVTVGQGRCDGGATVICTLGDLAPGASVTIRIDTVAVVAGPFVNTATVSLTETDINTGNNSNTLRGFIRAPSADMSVTMTDAPDPVRRGSNLIYTIQLHNAGPDTATNVRLTDRLPTDMRFVSVSSTQGNCSSNTTVNCALGNIASGAGATVTLVVRPRSTGSYTNSVNVSSDTADPRFGNDRASATTTVVR